MIGGQAGERRLVERAERGLGLEGPADGVRRARAVDEAKGVDAVIDTVGETVGERRGGDIILIGAGFGMASEIGLHRGGIGLAGRSEEHTSELQSIMCISYAVLCLKKKKLQNILKNFTSSKNTYFHIIINLCQTISK